MNSWLMFTSAFTHNWLYSALLPEINDDDDDDDDDELWVDVVNCCVPISLMFYSLLM